MKETRAGVKERTGLQKELIEKILFCWPIRWLSRHSDHLRKLQMALIAGEEITISHVLKRKGFANWGGGGL